MQEFVALESDAGKRTDVFVAEQFPEFARSSLKSLFDKGLVLVNERPEEPGDKIREGDRVKVDVSVLKADPAPIDLPIIYEDGDVVVIDKPAGLLTHSKGALNIEATVASFLRNKISDEKLTGNRAGIVHRLDRGTSGVIIGAKTSEALAKLQKQFSQRKTKKTYLAIVEGIPEQNEALIDASIARNPRKPQTFKVDALGKTAQTHYRVIKSKKTTSLLELKPVTGRTHQLRVHLAYIKHPIVGDMVYGKGDGNMKLHALSLEITLPNGERRVFESKPPKAFQEYLK